MSEEDESLPAEPGTCYVVAATYAVNVPTSSFSTPVGGGVSVGVSGGGAIGGHMILLTEKMIEQTKTEVAASEVKFMGVLRLVPGDRIDGEEILRDDLQRQMTQLIRPSSLSATGLSRYLTMTWMVNLEKSTVIDTAGAFEKFLLNAADDFRGSSWSRINHPVKPR